MIHLFLLVKVLQTNFGLTWGPIGLFLVPVKTAKNYGDVSLANRRPIHPSNISGHEFTASSDLDLWSVLLPKYVYFCKNVYSTLVSGSEPIMRSIDRVDHMLWSVQKWEFSFVTVRFKEFYSGSKVGSNVIIHWVLWVYLATLHFLLETAGIIVSLQWIESINLIPPLLLLRYSIEKRSTY